MSPLTITPKQAFHVVDNDKISVDELLDGIESYDILINYNVGYNESFNFLDLLQDYFQSNAKKYFNQNATNGDVIQWIMSNPTKHSVLRHPITGDTIWHKHPILVEVLTPPTSSKTPATILDIFTTHRDSIWGLENFFGITVLSRFKSMDGQ